MTPIERTQAIADKAALILPGLLTTALLSPFVQYINKSPLEVDDNEFCVYIDSDINNEDSLLFSALIQVQISGEDKVQEYHSVIMPFIEENIDADLVDYVDRDSIEADVWPMDNTSRSFIYYTVSFSSPSEDCD